MRRASTTSSPSYSSVTVTQWHSSAPVKSPHTFFLYPTPTPSKDTHGSLLYFSSGWLRLLPWHSPLWPPFGMSDCLSETYKYNRHCTYPESLLRFSLWPHLTDYLMKEYKATRTKTKQKKKMTPLLTNLSCFFFPCFLWNRHMFSCTFEFKMYKFQPMTHVSWSSLYCYEFPLLELLLLHPRIWIIVFWFSFVSKYLLTSSLIHC